MKLSVQPFALGASITLSSYGLSYGASVGFYSPIGLEASWYLNLS